MKDGSYKGAHLETRRSILDMLKLRGELTSSEMAKELGSSVMAVRQHLHELKLAGDVDCKNRSIGVGRPTKVWSLLGSSSRHFPDRHKDLAVDFISSVEKSLGSEAVETALSYRKEQQQKTYLEKLTDKKGLAERVQGLAEIRSAEGYMAEFECVESDVYILAENHCPVCDAASMCGQLCSNELEVFKACLGPGVSVDRTEHIVSGARRCAYRIEKIDRESKD